MTRLDLRELRRPTRTFEMKIKSAPWVFVAISERSQEGSQELDIKAIGLTQTVNPAGTLFRLPFGTLCLRRCHQLQGVDRTAYPGMELPNPGHDLVTETGTVEYAVMTDLLL